MSSCHCKVVQSRQDIVDSADVTKNIPLGHRMVVILRDIPVWSFAEDQLLVLDVQNERNVAHIHGVRDFERVLGVRDRFRKEDWWDGELLPVRNLLVVSIRTHSALPECVRGNAGKQRVVEVVAAIWVAIDPLWPTQGSRQRPVAVDPRVSEANVALRKAAKEV